MQERKSSKTFRHDTNLRIGVSVGFVFVGMVKNITMQKVLVLTQTNSVIFTSSENPNSNHPTKHKVDHNNKF